MYMGGLSLYSGAGLITVKAWSGSFRWIIIGSIWRRFDPLLTLNNRGGKLDMYLRGICVSYRGRSKVRG
jgi:hypothetical protein